MKRIRVFADAADFINYVKDNVAVPENQTPEQYALWIVCIQEAAAILEEFTLKDMANLLLVGLPGYSTEPTTSIDNWLSTFTADLAFAIEGGEPDPVVDGWISEDAAKSYNVLDVLEALHTRFPKVN